MPLLKSPLTFLGLLVLALGMVQLLPLPAALARRISPVAQEVYSPGTWSRLVLADDPEAVFRRRPQVRSPATLDRAATLRWLVGAAVCLGIFWTVSHYVDRLGRLYWVWGSVAAGSCSTRPSGSSRSAARPEGFSVSSCRAARRPGARRSTICSSRRRRRPCAGWRRRRQARTARHSRSRPGPGPPVPVRDHDGRPRAFLALGSMALPLAPGDRAPRCSPRAGAARALATGWATRAWEGLPC